MEPTDPFLFRWFLDSKCQSSGVVQFREALVLSSFTFGAFRKVTALEMEMQNLRRSGGSKRASLEGPNSSGVWNLKARDSDEKKQQLKHGVILDFWQINQWIVEKNDFWQFGSIVFFLGGGGILGKLVSELLFFMFHQKVVKMGHYHKLQSSYQIRTVGSVDRWVSGAWSWWKFGAARGFSPRNHPRAKLRKKSRSKNNAQNHPKQTKHWNFNGSLFKVIF